MSTDLYVDVTIDKKRRLKLTIMDMAHIYEELNRKRKTEVNGLTIVALLATNEWNVWADVLETGLKHQDPKITSSKCLALISEYAAKGGDTELVAEAIIEAMHRSGALHQDMYERYMRLRGRATEATAKSIDADPQADEASTM